MTAPTRPNAIRQILARMERMGPDILSLAGGVPGAHAYPRAYAMHLQRRLDGPAAMNYGDPRGDEALRERIAARACAWGIDAAPRALLVTTGAQQGLHLTFMSLLRAADAVVVPAPTYPGTLHLLRLTGLRAVEAAVDEQGLIVDAALEARFRAGARCIYVIPDFDNPTGTTLVESRRRALLEMAARHDVWVVEDLAYRELRYDGAQLAPLSAAARGPHSPKVVSVGSFSKSVMPSLRTGWISAAPALVNRMAEHLQAQQLTGSHLIQGALADFLIDGYDEHVALARAGYRRRREAMIAAVRRHMPHTRFAVPDGGFFLKLDLEPGVDDAALFELALERGRVACIPGSGFFDSEQPGGFVRLCFSTLDEASIEVAVRRLGRAYAQLTARLPSASLHAESAT